MNRQYGLEATVLETIGDRRQKAKSPPEPVTYARRTVLVFVDDLDLATLAALRYARSLRPTTLQAVHFVVDNVQADRLRQDWLRANTGISLEFVDCPDRRIAAAAEAMVNAEASLPGVGVTAILPRRSYAPVVGRLLHDRTADKMAQVISRIPYAVATIVPFDVRPAGVEPGRPPGRRRPPGGRLVTLRRRPPTRSRPRPARARRQRRAAARQPASRRPPLTPHQQVGPGDGRGRGRDRWQAGGRNRGGGPGRRPRRKARGRTLTRPRPEPSWALVNRPRPRRARRTGRRRRIRPRQRPGRARIRPTPNPTAPNPTAPSRGRLDAPSPRRPKATRTPRPSRGLRASDGTDYDRPAPPEGVNPIGSLTKPVRAVVQGRVHAVEIRPVEHSTVLACDVADSTGELTALFYGRSNIPGLRPGSKVRLRGQVGIRDGRPVMINPAYELLAHADDRAGKPKRGRGLARALDSQDTLTAATLAPRPGTLTATITSGAAGYWRVA